MKKDKRTTMTEIARYMGISKNAVSLALNGKPGVSDQLRARVKEVAIKMGYKGHMRQPMKGCILVLMPEHVGVLINNLFYWQLCRCMEAYAHSCGYQLVVSSVTEQEEGDLAHPRALESIVCVGIITMGNLSLAYCQMIQSLGIRYVMVDQYYNELAVDCVTGANAPGALLLTRHLIEKGHTRIAYFGKRHTASSLRERWIGYCHAMQEFQLPVGENMYERDTQPEQSNDDELIRESFKNMPQLPTAVLCGHDYVAVLVIRVLEEMGYKVPEDVSVVGFNDIQDPEISKLSLTTYQMDDEAIARAAIDLFNQPAEIFQRKVQIYGKYVFRESVKELNEGSVMPYGRNPPNIQPVGSSL